MRTLQALSIVCLLIYGVTAVPAEGKSHQVGLREHLERAKTCTLQCVAGEGSVSTSENWVIKIDVNIYLVYSAEHNYIGIYNVNLGIAVVYDSVSSILIVTNVKTGDSLVIRFHIALFVKGSGAVTEFDNQTGVYGGIDWCYQIILKYKAEVTVNTSTSTGAYFSITILLEVLSTSNGEIDLTRVVNGRTDLGLQLKGGFAVYFQYVSTGLKGGTISISGGAFVFVGIVFDLSKTGSSNVAIYSFFYVLYVKQIVITNEIIVLFYKSVTTNDHSKISEISIVLSSVGVLYESRDIAWNAWKAGSFAYFRASVTINSQTSVLIFSRDSVTKDWSIVIANSKYSMGIIYYSKINTLVFINFSLNLVVVFPSAGAFWSIYNGKTGVAISIGKLLGTAKVVDTNSVAISAAYNAGNLRLSIQLMFTVTTKVTIGIFEYRFVFNNFLNNIHKNQTFKFNAATEAKIKTNFNVLIENYKGIEGYNYFEGSANGLLIVFKGFQLGNLTKQCIVLVSVVCIKGNVLFNGSFMAEVYFSIQFSVKVGFSVSTIFKIGGGGNSSGVSSSSSSSSSYAVSGGSSYSSYGSSSISYGPTYTYTVKS